MNRLSPSRIFGAIFVLLIILILAIAAYQLMPKPSQQELIEATVAAGVAARSTEVANLTGTPNPTEIQRTVNAIVEATLNAPSSAARSDSTPPPLSATEQVAAGTEGLLNSIWEFILNIWNFMGFAGIYSQICCCLLPFILVIAGAAADKARPR